MHFVIIDDETGNAHDIIFLFKVWIVLEIIDVGRYIFIIRGNTLRRRYKVGAHCAGKRYGNLHIERLADAFDAFLQCFTHVLPRTCRIVHGKNKRIKFMSAGYAVETKSFFISFRVTDRNGMVVFFSRGRDKFRFHLIGKGSQFRHHASVFFRHLAVIRIQAETDRTGKAGKYGSQRLPGRIIKKSTRLRFRGIFRFASFLHFLFYISSLDA